MRAAAILLLVTCGLPCIAAAQSKPLASDEERLKASEAAAKAWFEPCKQSLRGLAERIAPLCPAAVVSDNKAMYPLIFKAVSRRARCGLVVRVGGSFPETGQPVWMTSRSPFFPGWESVERTRHGFALEVAARGTARVRRSLLEIGKIMAETCTAPSDDGYREYRLTVVKEDQIGTCIQRGGKVGREVLVIHAQTAVVEYEYGGSNRRLLQLDGQRWTSETHFDLSGPLFGCGPAVDCVNLLGGRTIRWRLAWNEKTLAAQLTTVDVNLKEEPVCRVHVEFQGELIPQ